MAFGRRFYVVACSLVVAVILAAMARRLLQLEAPARGAPFGTTQEPPLGAAPQLALGPLSAIPQLALGPLSAVPQLALGSLSASPALELVPAVLEMPTSCNASSFVGLWAAINNITTDVYNGSYEGPWVPRLERLKAFPRLKLRVVSDLHTWAAGHPAHAHLLPRIGACAFHCTPDCWPPLPPPAPVPIVHDPLLYARAYNTSWWWAARRDEALLDALYAGRFSALLTYGAMVNNATVPEVGIALDACIDHVGYVSTDTVHFEPLNGCWQDFSSLHFSRRLEYDQVCARYDVL